MKNRVFVYGTLKKGHGNHVLLRESEYQGAAQAPPGFRMVSLGGFPGVVEGEGEVHGEVYLVNDNTMERLDRLEGFPSFYSRTLIPTPYGPAWMYTLNQYEYGNHPAVEGGEW
jgi:gamma-glutamylcyclotransferase (GGCT)/AIG2-like uncharacterized protein YtfP